MPTPRPVPQAAPGLARNGAPRARPQRSAARAPALIALALVTLALGLGIPRLDSAQAAAGFLIQSSPANGSRLSSAPREIVLIFSLPLASTSRVTLSGSSGVVTSGTPLIAGSTATQVLPFGLPDDDYTVAYSADFASGGSTSGTIHFTVGPAASPTTSAPGPTTPTVGPSPAVPGKGASGSPGAPRTSAPAAESTRGGSGAAAAPTSAAAGPETGEPASGGWPLPPWPVLLLPVGAVAALLLDRRGRGG